MEHAIIVLPQNGVYTEFRIVRQPQTEPSFARERFYSVVFGRTIPSEEYVRAAIVDAIIKTTIDGLMSQLSWCEHIMMNRGSIFGNTTDQSHMIIASLKSIGAAIMRNYKSASDYLAVPEIAITLPKSMSDIKMRAFVRCFIFFASLQFDDDVQPVAPDHGECAIADRLRAVLGVFQIVAPTYDLRDMQTDGIIDVRVSRARIVLTFRAHLGAHPLRVLEARLR